jgi:hypothetical protein
MGEIDDIRHRLRVSKLRAQRELLEIERGSLLREVLSSLTSQDRREEAMERRMDLENQCSQITERLKTLGD